MKSYWADIAFIVEPGRERALFIHFQAKSHKEAVEDAIRFAKNREREFQGWVFSCLKVGRFQPTQIDAEGYYSSPNGFGFFEWKYDWPGTIDERVEAISVKE